MHAQSNTRPRRLPLAQRQALILAALPTLERIARHLVYVCGSPRLEADDLAQIAALACLEQMAKGFTARGNKVAFLVVVGRRAMQRYCGVYQSLIRTPRTKNGFQPALLTLSLDAPLFADSDETLLDVLADEYNALYDCYLDSLPGEEVQG